MVDQVDDGEFGSVYGVWLGNDERIVGAFREAAFVSGRRVATV
jgi:hypothetical protein